MSKPTRQEAIAKTAATLRKQVVSSGGKDPGQQACVDRVRQAVLNKESR